MIKNLIKNIISSVEEVKSYKFKYKRLGDRIWSSYKVVGHKWFDDQNKMVLYLCNGGIHEIPEWTKCGLHLERDWAEATVEMRKKEVENKDE